ncbi:glutaminase [Flavobacteriaceae bacterium Ap0902]|nr:glutaminase [Flavobacteriaceae bacterium Ap0902]
MDFEDIIKRAYQSVENLENKGQLASYIPELARVDPTKFGVHISTLKGYHYGFGDFAEKFSIQSIAKVLSLALAYERLGGEIWSRVGVEPSGTGYNSLVQLENDNGIPRNPFINAGALVICDILITLLDNPKEELLGYINNVCSLKNIQYSPKIAASEKSVGYRNMSLCYFIKSFGNIENDPDEVLDFYFDLCSLEGSCQDLSELFLFLANGGKSVFTGEQIVATIKAKRINSIMQTCGFYDESGQFAFKVGLPGKSGVGGGIIALLPQDYVIAVWSPKLNEKGNSYKGMKFLEAFTTLSEVSIF